ncbi:MAG: hypothetical protein ACK5B9_12890 [Flavobacteriia bacterium]|jgi:hypothetical protein
MKNLISIIEKANQKEKTELYKQHLINSGNIFLSLNEYKNLFLEIGLKLDLKNHCTHKYYNVANEQKFLHCTTDLTDETGKGFANIYGKFYKEEIKNNTQKYKRLREIRNTYFTQLKTGHILDI